MRRRDLIAVGGTLAILGLAPARGMSIETEPAIMQRAAEFLESLPGLLEISGVPGITIGLVVRGRITWQHHAHCVIDRILRAATGREHPVFLWA